MKVSNEKSEIEKPTISSGSKLPARAACQHSFLR